MTPGTELLICIVPSHRLVDEILTGYLDVGIHGATVMDAKGMVEILSTQVPIFAGFKSLFPVGGGHRYMILSVVEPELIDKGVRLVEEVVGDFDEPGAGILFTVPLTRVKGLASDA